jgi:hypothetical protein
MVIGRLVCCSIPTQRELARIRRARWPHPLKPQISKKAAKRSARADALD